MNKRPMWILIIALGFAVIPVSFAKQPTASESAARPMQEPAGEQAPQHKRDLQRKANGRMPPSGPAQAEAAKSNMQQAKDGDGRCSCEAQAECVTNRGAHFCTNEKGKRRMLTSAKEKN